MMPIKEIIDFQNDRGKNANPNLNDVLQAGIEGEADELFNHAWLQARSLIDEDSPELVVCCEPWDRSLTGEEGRELLNKVRGLESQLCAFYDKVYLTIENYL